MSDIHTVRKTISADESRMSVRIKIREDYRDRFTS